MSNTSRRHSRYASSNSGNLRYRAATFSRSYDRFRNCHSGDRISARRRGSSSARPAASLNRPANSAVEPNCRSTSCIASADSTRNQSESGGSSVSGKRTTNPSSPHSVSTSGPPDARIRALTAIAHGI